MSLGIPKRLRCVLRLPSAFAAAVLALMVGSLLTSGTQVAYGQSVAFTATAVSSTQVNLSWPPFGNSPGAVDLRRCEGVGCNLGNSAIIVEGPVTNGAAPGLPNPGSYQDFGVKPGTTYTYQVTTNGAGFLRATVTTPGGLFATAVSGTQINLVWSKAGTDATVTLRRCAGAGCSTPPGTEIALNLGNPGSYQDTGLTPGTSYTYQVTTCCSGFFIATAQTPDTIPPTITSSQSPAANAAGWNNTDVTVSFTCADNGVIASCTSASTVSAEGSTTVTGTACDAAGNCTSTSRTVNVDKSAPTIDGAASQPNASGWSNTPVTVAFTCGDALSGIASCASPITLATEGATQSAGGTAVDAAGNSASTSVGGINIDFTAPTITGAPDRAANANGWYNANVTVSFTCADALSGVATCSAPVTLQAEATNQGATGTVSDKAGNGASASVSGINIDKTAPAVTYAGNAGTYTVDQSVNVTCSAADGLSGVASSTCQNVAGPAYSFALGSNTFSATATDKAGNTGAGSTTFTVRDTADSLCALTGQFVTGPGAAGRTNSLCSKLSAADAAAARGNTTAKANAINAYVNEVNAQAGKALTSAQTAILIRLAGAL